MARKKNATTVALESLVAQGKDLGLQLAGLQQNVNTVGQVAAGNSTAASAGSARAGLAGGFDPKLLLLGAAVAAYFFFKK